MPHFLFPKRKWEVFFVPLSFSQKKVDYIWFFFGFFMTLRDHTILGGLAGVALYPVMGFNALWFFGASVLIDIDHYLDFIYHNRLRDLSLRGMFLYHDTLSTWWARPEFLNMEVFHTVEFLAPLLLLAIVLGSGMLLALFFGFIFHVVLDIIYLTHHGIPEKRVHTILGYFRKKGLMAERGLDPARLYESAVEVVAASRGKTGRACRTSGNPSR